MCVPVYGPSFDWLWLRLGNICNLLQSTKEEEEEKNHVYRIFSKGHNQWMFLFCFVSIYVYRRSACLFTFFLVVGITCFFLYPYTFVQSKYTVFIIRFVYDRLMRSKLK